MNKVPFFGGEIIDRHSQVEATVTTYPVWPDMCRNSKTLGRESG
jgi:hypothetical protein